MSDPETVFSTPWFSIERESFPRLEAYKSEPFYRFRTGDGVVILALTNAQEVILVRQFRPSFNDYSLELPSGFIDEGESPREAGARELLEETGYVCESLQEVGTTRAMMNRVSGLELSVFGEGAVRAPSAVVESDIEVVLAPLNEFRDLICSGEFHQSSSLAMITLLNVKFGRNLLA